MEFNKIKLGERLYKILRQYSPDEKDGRTVDWESEGVSGTNLDKFQVYHSSSDKIDPFEEIIWLAPSKLRRNIYGINKKG